MVRRARSRNSRDLARRSPLQGPDFDGSRYVRARPYSGSGLRPDGMPAFGRRRLGPAVNAAVGDGVSARDRRLERAERPQARRSEQSRFRLLSGRPRPSGAHLRSDSVRLNLLHLMVVASKDHRRRPDLVPLPHAGRPGPFLAEFVRINPRVLWGLSEAQLISIVIMAGG